MNKFTALKKKYGWKYALYAIPIKILSEIDKLFYKDLGKKSITVNNYKMLLDYSKEGLNRELFVNKIREKNNTLVFSSEIKEGDVILDLGANEGYFALLESKKVGKKGLVYAVEPVKSNYEQILKNIKLNKIKNIETLRLAIGDKNGFVDMKIGKKMNWCSASDKAYFDVNRTERVKMVTIDKFLEKKKTPKIIRMDVEGYEYQILKGMNNSLNKIDKILMEFHFQFLLEDQVKEMFNLLNSKGFKIKKIMWDTDVALNNKFFTKIVRYLAESRSPIRDGVSKLSYNEILSNKEIMRGSAGCPNILFEKVK